MAVFCVEHLILETLVVPEVRAGSFGVIYALAAWQLAEFPAFLVISGQLGWTIYEPIRCKSSILQFVVMMMCFKQTQGEFFS